MLGKQGIITTDEMNDIIKGLESIRVDLDNGTFSLITVRIFKVCRSTSY